MGRNPKFREDPIATVQIYECENGGIFELEKLSRGGLIFHGHRSAGLEFDQAAFAGIKNRLLIMPSDTEGNIRVKLTNEGDLHLESYIYGKMLFLSRALVIAYFKGQYLPEKSMQEYLLKNILNDPHLRPMLTREIELLIKGEFPE